MVDHSYSAGGSELRLGCGRRYSNSCIRWERQRLTDEEWRGSLESATNPPRPSWQQIFLAGVPPSPAPPTGLEAGLLCRDLAAREYGFWEAAIYWASEGAPDRMEPDKNGIPC